MKVLLTGGGSGGHVSPSLAVASLLQSEKDEHQLLYIGGNLTMEGSTGPSIEESLVKPTGIPYISIPAGKLRRDGLSIKTLVRLWGFFPGMIRAIWEVRKFNPDVVFSSGGYVSLPVVWAAALWRKPIVIHEQTAAVGLTNSLSARVASKIAITFSQSIKFFPQDKVVLTGNPIRRQIIDPKPQNQELVKWVKQADKPLLLVTGGGQGSHIINVTIEAMLEALLDSYCLVHQCGAHAQFQDFERLEFAKKSLAPELARRYWPSRHFSPDEMGFLFQQAAVVIGRSGANTVLELAALGVPAIFIPIPWVTHDEQTKNAMVLHEIGLASIIPEKELNPQRLRAEINQQMVNITNMDQARTAAKALADSDAATRLVELLKEVANKSK